MFLIPEVNGANGVHFSRVLLNVGGIQQTGILTDSGTDGGGASGIVLDDFEVNGNNGVGRPLVFKGGFDYFINRGGCQNGAGTFTGTYCLQLTNVSPAVTTSNPSQVPGRVKVNGLYLAGGAVGIDCLPNGLGVAPLDFEFDTTIFESAVAPYLRFNCPTGVFNDVVFRDVVEADSIVGFGTPVVDAQNGGNIFSVLWAGGSVGNSNQPLLIAVTTGANALTLDGPFTNPGNTSFLNITGLGISGNGLVSTSGSGHLFYSMPTPPAPGVVVSSGGSVPNATPNAKNLWISQRKLLTPRRISYIMLTTKSATTHLPQPLLYKGFDIVHHSAPLSLHNVLPILRGCLGVCRQASSSQVSAARARTEYTAPAPWGQRRPIAVRLQTPSACC
jgi:hypothetical protein